MKTQPIYLDYNATSLPLTGLEEYLRPFFSKALNASSIHYYGRSAHEIIEHCRTNLLALLGADDHYQCIFTSGGTEANNLIINGLEESYPIFTSTVEHPSILNNLHCTNRPHHLIDVDEQGYLKLDQLEAYAKKYHGKFLLSLIHAHNETGIIQPLHDIIPIIKQYDGLIHLDTVQSFGKTPLHLANLDVDAISLSGHKVGALQGIGSLIIRKNITLTPQIIGGGQEKKMRSGTENILAIASLNYAIDLLSKQKLPNPHILSLRDYLENSLQSLNPDIVIIGHTSNRLANTSYVITPTVSADIQLVKFDLQGFMVSRGSACSSGTITASNTLNKMGIAEKYHNCGIRISLGHQTTQSEIDHLLTVYQKDIAR